MLRKRIFASLLIVVLMLAFSSVTSVFAASEITWDVISNDQIMTNVTDNLNLVKTLDDGAEVTWTSSKPECVDTDGVVTRWEEDKAVTLTATYGSVTRTYNITVSACESGKTVWTDDSLKGRTLAYQNVKWTAASTDSGAKYEATSPLKWKYDEENDRLYTETQYGRWDYDYGLTIDGVNYKWSNLAAVQADTSLKNTTFTYNDKSYTFYYIDKDFADADGNPYIVGVCAPNNSSLTAGWMSFYVNIDEGTGEVSVDTTKPLALALEGNIKQNLEPVVVDLSLTNNVKYRSHLNLTSNGYSYNDVKGVEDGYERFSFRYRQVHSQAEKWEPYFSFFYNNKAFGISPNNGPGREQTTANWNHYYYTPVEAYYTDGLDSASKFTVGKVGSSVSMLGSASEPLSVKTTTEGLSSVPQLVHANYGNWREIVMETDRANKYTVMYIDGQPVYWKGEVSGVTYYSPFIVHSNYTGTSADPVRTGFSCPITLKPFTDFEVENVKLERITVAEVTAVAAGATVTSVTGNDAVINFARKGNYTVIFAEYGEGDALAAVSMESVTVSATGDTTVTAALSPENEWDRIFIWSSHGALIPLCASANIADLAAAE